MTFLTIFLGTIEFPQMMLILAVILLLFGGKKIPELMKGLGSGVKEFKKAAKDDTVAPTTTVKEEEAKIEHGHKNFSIFDYPQLYLGMLAIFIYVGTEVTIISNLPALLKTAEFGNILEEAIPPFIALYWGSLMIGRWNGGVNVFDTSKTTNLILKFIVPALAFGVIIFTNIFAEHNVSAFYIYPVWILIFIFT